MSREVKRVPAHFGWELGKVWGGYVTPEYLQEETCPDCENGYSPEAWNMHQQWYGWAAFEPTSTGSTPFGKNHEAVQALARHNVERSPQYYGSGDEAIGREAERLATLFDAAWMHHLSQADVDALIAEDRLMDFTWHFEEGKGRVKNAPPTIPTAAEVNAWSLFGFGHDSINTHICIRMRCERESIPYVCSTCSGQGSTEKWAGQRDFADTYQWIEPPEGEWWQLWETVSEGSPVTPPFETAEELAQHLHENPRVLGPGSHTLSLEAARKWVLGDAWIPSGIIDSSGVKTGAQLIDQDAQ